MIQIRTVFAVSSAVAISSLLAQAPPATDRLRDGYHPPEPLEVTVIEFPIRSVAYGTVVLHADVEETGRVKGVHVIRGIVSLNEAVIPKVKEWKFQPAKLDGKVVPSLVTIAVMFSPNTFWPTDVPLPPRAPTQKDEPAAPRYVPPDVVSALFPAFPTASAVVPGMVALGPTVSSTGEVEDTKVLRDLPTYTPQVLNALKRWKFAPARFDGEPLAAPIVVVMIFRLPPVVN